MQNGQTGATTLGEELDFMDAYIYLLETRYEGKIFFTIDITPGYGMWTLPAFSIQPLIENAVKHNTITKSLPLTITVATEEGNLIISNEIHPKLDVPDGTGIGLKNLSKRSKLLTGKHTPITNHCRTSSVILPLTPPQP